MINKVEKIQISTNFPIGPVNVYLIYGQKLTLIDTGPKTKQAWHELNNGLQKHGLSIYDIEQIILTHHHNDHIGLLEWIIERHPIPIMAHEQAQPYLYKIEDYMVWSEVFFRSLYIEFGVPVDLVARLIDRKKKLNPRLNIKLTKTLRENEVIPGLSDWQVIETKGHSQDHISLHCPLDRLLICGDHVVQGKTTGVFLEAPNRGEERAKPLIQYKENLERCLKIPVELTLPGHGPVIHKLKEVIHEQLNRIENRMIRVKKVLEKESRTGFEIIQEMYPTRYQKLVGLLIPEILGVLDLLQERGEVKIETKNGINTYHLVNI